MSDADLQAAQRTAAVIAFRHIDDVGENAREQVLIALVESLPEREADLAQQMLFHMREERRLQLVLGLVLSSPPAIPAAS